MQFNNISPRYFHRTTEFIDRAITGGGLVVVNCYMGLSRSSSVVIAYLITKHNMSFDRVSSVSSHISDF